MTVREFWELTPRETFAALDAAAWRIKRDDKQMASLAWHTATLTRARRLPTLAQMLARVESAWRKTRTDAPMEERREEFEELKARMMRVKTKKGAEEGAETAPLRSDD